MSRLGVVALAGEHHGPDYAIDAHTLLVGGPSERSQRLEVLHHGGEVKLFASARETANAHTLEAMLDLQVCKTHLDLFACITRLLELRGALQ